ncbi:nitroreductase family protein [Actinotalea sp. BY-33]|uniref:Nitroreductase family protein n=1 Tax=Actinotalea soli TaxID=2819234 RepID=A0A939RU64_9CELL|nr:nitroreductase family protein [Actinotalea soli]MBO1750955.1 nitroreductase family protein [Actinotalea soli]
MIKKLKRIAKDLLAIPAVRKAYELANRGVLTAAGTTRLGATLYSIPGFGTFNREQFAVLSGRRAYYENLRRSRSSHVELRRNIHRLEKGILMRPRRDAFAKDYILETVDFYRTALRRGPQDPVMDASEMTWAHDVLAEYFAVVTVADPVVDRARAVFTSLEHSTTDGTVKPYVHGDIPQSDVTYEQLAALSMQRRSVRWFLDKPVERELLDKALLVGRQSPTACNRLPYEYLVFDDPAMVERVAGIPFGAAGYAHQIPTLIVVKGRLDSYFSPRDRHVIYIDAALASMGFMYALETLGLSSSVINWPDFEPLEAKMAKTLGLAPYERVIMLIAVGYADPTGLVAFSQKKDLDVLRSFNSLES